MSKEEILDKFRYYAYSVMNTSLKQECILPAMNMYAKQRCKKPMELLKEARDMLVLASLLDKSGKCMEVVNKIDKKFPQFNK